MWKHWKKEIIGISAAAVAVICIIAVFTLRMNEAVRKSNSYKPHLMVEDTIYWLYGGSTFPSLPEDCEEFARVETKIPSHQCTEKNGQANGFPVDTPLYRKESQPGCIYAPESDGRWVRLTVLELGQAFLRYNEILYISPTSWVPFEMNYSPAFDPEDFTSTGETIRYPGAQEIIPMENCTTNMSFLSGCDVYLNPAQPELLLLRYTRTQNGQTKISYYPFVTADFLGLDYSAYEPK